MVEQPTRIGPSKREYKIREVGQASTPNPLGPILT